MLAYNKSPISSVRWPVTWGVGSAKPAEGWRLPHTESTVWGLTWGRGASCGPFVKWVQASPQLRKEGVGRMVLGTAPGVGRVDFLSALEAWPPARAPRGRGARALTCTVPPLRGQAGCCVDSHEAASPVHNERRPGRGRGRAAPGQRRSSRRRRVLGAAQPAGTAGHVPRSGPRKRECRVQRVAEASW